MPTFNSERGEVPLSIGGVELVIAATMQGLAQVSGKLRCQSFSELYQRLIGLEINAVIAGVESLAIKGDVGKAMAALSIKDLPACKVAFLAAIMHHAEGLNPGNVEAAEGVTKESLGGSGSSSPSEP